MPPLVPERALPATDSPLPPVAQEQISDPAYPDGWPIGSSEASGTDYEGQGLLHRPHAFALMHGNNGAKIAYGQLLYKIDVLTLNWVNLGSSHGHVNFVSGAGQDAIGSLIAVVPTIDTSDGKAMDGGINFNSDDEKYHQLDGYGDVYLNWTVALDEGGSDHVTECWVSTTAGGQTDVPALTANWEESNFHLRGSDGAGSYRVTLGTVNEDAQVTQLISSDVHWSIFGLKRTYAS
jgi:hypothetical protein